MRYYQLGQSAPDFTFRDVIMSGMEPGGTLFMPEHIPTLSPSFFSALPSLSLPQIAQEVLTPFIGDEIPAQALRNILSDAINFPIPLHPLSKRIAILELFYGPTLAFKDVGARVLARCMEFFHGLESANSQPVTIVVATSGDTGGAVGSGFSGRSGTRVVILYPKGRVSAIQQAQLNSFSGNVLTLEIEGTFDDCQALVKQCLADESLRQKLRLSSANSINFGRLLPQAVYYFWAYAQWLRSIRSGPQRRLLVTVPSGNLGNLTAGLIAKAMGLDIDEFLVACNANDSFPRFLQTNHYEPKASITTISNAMDVGHPNNFSRVVALCEKQRIALRGATVSDKATGATISRIYKEYGYVLDPHAAVGMYATEEVLRTNPDLDAIVLHTAHPAKFGEVVSPFIGQEVPLPKALADCLTRVKQPPTLPVDYDEVVRYLGKTG